MVNNTSLSAVLKQPSGRPVSLGSGRRGMAYYNEHDPDAAEVIRCAIEDGLIAPGHVDERSICDVQGSDLKGFIQCHFFAGAGTWSYALRLAGWPDNLSVWTASCPCPPFSAAGKKKNCPACGGRVVPHPRQTGVFACIECRHEWLADERHLWPELLRLVQECRPPVIFGEQVAGPDGLTWFAGVRGTLEAEGYTAGAADLCGPWVGSPDLRQRLWWHAVRSGHPTGKRCGEAGHPIDRCEERACLPSGSCRATDAIVQRAGARVERCKGRAGQRRDRLAIDGGPGRPCHAPGQGCQGAHAELLQPGQEEGRLAGGSGHTCGPADATPRGLGIDGGAPGEPGHTDERGKAGGTTDPIGRGCGANGIAGGLHEVRARRPDERVSAEGAGPGGYLGFWDYCRRVHYADGKDRRVEPESFGLDHGIQLGLEACRTEGLSEEEAAAVKTTWPTARGFPCRRPLLKLWGNAIKPQVAAAFIRACMEIRNE